MIVLSLFGITKTVQIYEHYAIKNLPLDACGLVVMKGEWGIARSEWVVRCGTCLTWTREKFDLPTSLDHD